MCFRGASVDIHKEKKTPQSRKEREVLIVCGKEFLRVSAVKNGVYGRTLFIRIRA
jgi:hypothetical protein